jgi:hypothetical protein
MSQIHIPAFNAADPELSLVLLERAFVKNEITTEIEKFNATMDTLNSNTVKEVRDVVISPPAENPYTALKTALIQRLATSREKQVRQLFDTAVIGEMKPSQFLRHLRQLGGADISDNLLRTMWADRLPQHLQAAVALQIDTPLDKVATVIDHMHDLVPSRQVYATSTQEHNATFVTKSELVAELGDIKAQITKLTEAVEKLGQRDRSRNRSRGRSPHSSSQNPDYCYFHNRFGDKAYKCVKPCTYQQGNARSSQ